MKAVMIALAALAMMAGVANAQEPVSVTLSWTNPTTRVDGTALDPAAIMEHRVWCDVAGGWPPTRFVPAADSSVVLTFEPGVHSCYVKTVLTEKGADDRPLVSDASVALEFTVEAPVPPATDVGADPSAPSQLKVTQILIE